MSGFTIKYTVIKNSITLEKMLTIKENLNSFLKKNLVVTKSNIKIKIWVAIDEITAPKTPSFGIKTIKRKRFIKQQKNCM